MADNSKAQKLASARKKFKELKKEKNKKNNPQETNENAEPTVQFNHESVVPAVAEVTQNVEIEKHNTQLPNYFNENLDNNQPPGAFFDTFSQSTNRDSFTHSNNSSINFFVNNPIESQQSLHHQPYIPQFSEQQPQLSQPEPPQFLHQQPHLSQFSYQQPQISQQPELPQNQQSNYNFPNDTSNYFQNFDAANRYILDQGVVEPPDPNKIEDGSGDASTVEAEPSNIEEQSNKTPPLILNQIESVPQNNSCLEALNQLSNEMAQLIDPSSEFLLPNTDTELELRNQELASQLNQEKIKNEKLNASIQNCQIRIDELEKELKEEKLNSDSRNQQDLNNLRQELQNHTQTIGILVGENAELQANLAKFKGQSTEKTSECDELQARLKTSRSRVADLEREVQLLRNEKSQFDNLGKEKLGEAEQLRKECQNLKLAQEEMNQDLLEAQEKLKQSQESNVNLQQKINELSGQLSMATIKIQQLSTGDQSAAQIEQLTYENTSLKQLIEKLYLDIKNLSKESEESSLQYQQYAQQLNAQLSSLANRIEELQKEKELLLNQEQSRIKHIGELERQLQSIQHENVSFNASNRTNGEVKAELEKSSEIIQQLETDIAHLREDYDRIIKEKETLSRDIEIKQDSIRQLEDLVEDLRSNRPDNAKILAIMESDKVAASRAILQNTELKSQMDSMQEVFMKLNNDKVELTEQLVAEQRNSKELTNKLETAEHHLKTLADAVAIKDKELCHLRDSSVELSKQFLSTEQLSDRLRHYEAQNHSFQSLQQELQKAQQTIASLEAEIILLRAPVNMGMEVAKEEEPEEIRTLQDKLEKLELKNQQLELKLSQQPTIENGIDNTTPNTDTNHNDSLDKESAMKFLEEKFLKTMNEIANLTEEKQRLEHLVLQLQSETETIGEYVALYQKQRSILKQRAIEKDQQLNQLANDREQMKSKLEKLNELFKKLIVEKGPITNELLQHHDNLNKDSHELCDEHARIHSEINKITENTIKVKHFNGDNQQSTETAEEIIALLSEIKSSNLVQPTEDFHHCPWCSGQLMTV